jgi:hypothetical protein
MRIFLAILFSFTSFLGLGQSISAPDSKSFTVNTTGQDASGFSLSGFNSGDILLCAVGLPTAPAGTTFYFTTATGLTPASGYTMTGNKNRIAFTGTMANINNALASLKINTPATVGSIQISISATVNPTGFFYNPTNGHFYRPIATGATYTNARAAALNTTFKGQGGYLVTITSADEDAFIFNNVPQSNIWFALTDEVEEARWTIDAGPEKGTLIKINNGQTNGNIPGQYNNWAGGEPNNSGNEDYAVTKWGGGSQWNDLPNNFSCAYVIEYGTWTNPDNSTFTDFYTNSTIHNNGPALSVRFNISTNNIVNSNLTGIMHYQPAGSTTWTPSTNTERTMTLLGGMNVTSDIDTSRVATNTYLSTIAPGGVEWSYINAFNGVLTLYIDMRQVTVNANLISNVSILDVYSGPVTFLSNDGTWAMYRIPEPCPKLTDGTSQYNSYIRNAGYDNYAFSCSVTLTQNMEYKKQALFLNYNSSLSALYNSVVTVSDVYTAFRQLATQGGLTGTSNGTAFTSPIQYIAADVDANGIFNEKDCFELLQHITGVRSLKADELSDIIRILGRSTYDGTTGTNWNIVPQRSFHQIALTSGVLTYTNNISVFWKGDVNMSHSPAQSTSGMINMSVNPGMITKTMSLGSSSSDVKATIISELVKDELIFTVQLDPAGQNVVGVQFMIHYDNSMISYKGAEFIASGSPTNFAVNRGDYVSLGSLITDGNSTLDNSTKYVLKFATRAKMTNTLGLISVQPIDAVTKSGTQIKINIF